MHDVILHILERRSKTVPVDDGRKIALVLFGGVMAGVRGAGALVALEEMGLQNAFDEIYAVSAGFANASYFLAGQAKLGTSIYYEDLCGRKFVNFYKPWKVLDVDYVIDVMSNKQVLDVARIMANSTKLFVKLLNTEIKRTVYKEVHEIPTIEYAEVIRAAIAVPYLYPHAIKVGLGRYKDPDFHADVCEFISNALNANPTDVLIVYNTSKQAKDAVRALGGMPQNVYEIIPPSDWQLGKFETRREKLQAAAGQMGSFTKGIFGEEGGTNLSCGV